MLTFLYRSTFRYIYSTLIIEIIASKRLLFQKLLQRSGSHNLTTTYTGKPIKCEEYDSTGLLPDHILTVSFRGQGTDAGSYPNGYVYEIRDKDGNDLYPMIRRLAREKNKEKHDNMVRLDYIERLGYYCTESSEHNAEYNPYYIKSKYPELIERFNIPIDEYLHRCVDQINRWEKQRDELMRGVDIEHTRSNEYAARIMEAIVDNTPYSIGGNVLNRGLITHLPEKAVVEVSCLVDGRGIRPTAVGELPLQLAAMNISNINTQLLTIEAAVTGKREHLYQAAMFDPHTAAELSIDDIKAMVDELIEAHGEYMKDYQ